MLNYSTKNRRKDKAIPLPLEQQFTRSDILQIKQDSDLTWDKKLDFLYCDIEDDHDPCANLLGVSEEELAAAKAAWAAADAAAVAAQDSSAQVSIKAEAEGDLSEADPNTGQESMNPKLAGDNVGAAVGAKQTDESDFIANTQATSDLDPASVPVPEILTELCWGNNHQSRSLEQALIEAKPFSSELNIEQMAVYCGELTVPNEAQGAKARSAAPDSYDSGINWAWQELLNMEAQFAEAGESKVPASKLVTNREVGADNREIDAEGECWPFDPHADISSLADESNEPESSSYETEPLNCDEPNTQEQSMAAGDDEQSIANFGKPLSHQQRCHNFRFTMVEPNTKSAAKAYSIEAGVGEASVAESKLGDDEVVENQHAWGRNGDFVETMPFVSAESHNDSEQITDEQITAAAMAPSYSETISSAHGVYQHLDQYFIDLTQSFEKSYERQAFYNLMLNLGADIRQALIDPDVTEIMVNSDGQIFIEMAKTGMRHVGALSSESAQAVIRILASLESKELNMEHPILSGEIPRLNARFEGLLPPLVTAPVFSIRRHHFQNLTLDQLFNTGMLTAEQHQVLLEALKEHFSIVVCGATSSGKTTLINGLICEIAKTFPQERIITIEDTPELRILSCNKLNLYTSDHVDMSSLVRSSLRLRPDRLIVGEVRGAEALDLLDAFSTGHRGGLTSIHAGSIEQALNRLTLLVSRHPKAPRLIEPTVGDAIDLLVVVQRMPYRHVCHMAKLNGYRNQAFSYEEINF